MGPNWGRQDPGGPHVGPVNFAIWEVLLKKKTYALSIMLIGFWEVYPYVEKCIC